MTFHIKNEQIETKLREIAKDIASKVPKGWGFTLLMFDFNKEKDGGMFYISTAQRETMILSLEELLDNLKEGGEKNE
jgi:hypothetical protein